MGQLIHLSASGNRRARWGIISVSHSCMEKTWKYQLRIDKPLGCSIMMVMLNWLVVSFPLKNIMQPTNQPSVDTGANKKCLKPPASHSRMITLHHGDSLCEFLMCFVYFLVEFPSSVGVVLVALTVSGHLGSILWGQPSPISVEGMDWQIPPNLHTIFWRVTQPDSLVPTPPSGVAIAWHQP